jgi:hypothetical protein
MALAPAGLAAQGLGVAAKIGTLGYGVDAGLALSGPLVLRAGVAFSPEELPFANLLPTDDIGGFDYDILVPTTTFMAGVDLHVLGPLKLMGGVIYRTEDLALRSDVSGTYDIGGDTYSTDGQIQFTLDQSEILPYVGIGFGKLVGNGIGIYADIAVAYSNEADIVASASDNLLAIPGFQASLQNEVDDFTTDLPSAVEQFYPVVQIGLRFGLGGR